jgi:2-dehydro-3-deoxyphosphogluconate aldolase/(4S)-4-hydroxy-2-oxoglutarate aldolase
MIFDLLDAIRRHRLIAILRGFDPDRIVPLAEALYEGGIRLIEVTMNTPDAERQLRALAERSEGRWHVGAGTVLDAESARRALACGAAYFVTPNVDEEVLAFAAEAGVDILPGALTPTEIARAHKLGARAVKLFPASRLGPGYIRDLQGPLPHIPLVAVGGVELENAPAYLEAGAVGLGLGSRLLDRQALRDGNYAVITQRAREFVRAAGL